MRYNIIIFNLMNAVRRVRFFLHFRKKGWLESGVNINVYGKLEIGNNCIIGKNSKINIAKSARLKISDNVILGGNCQIEVENEVVIEANVTISDNVFLADVTHDFPTVSPFGERKVLAEDSTIISEGCWLGRNVVINPGCSIAKYNIIAANSVVSKSITSSWGLYGGVPAVFIKSIEKFDYNF